MVRMFRWMMAPSNLLCDLLHVAGEPERGVVRMLLNTLVCTTLGVLTVWAIGG
ncbi:MAG: hypothetical protein ACREFW_07360 [Rhizomicrobium sp.]